MEQMILYLKRNYLLLIGTSLFCYCIFFGCRNDHSEEIKILDQIPIGLMNIDNIEYSSKNPNYAIYGIVNLGPRLYEELVKMQKEGFLDEYYVIEGDVIKDEDEEKKAHYHIILQTSKSKIAVRLKYDKKEYKMFHILGYVGLK